MRNVFLCFFSSFWLRARTGLYELTNFLSGYFGTLTVGNNAELFTRINGIFNSSMAIAANITGIVASSAWQPIPRSTTNKADLTGGNSLGLDASRDRMCKLPIDRPPHPFLRRTLG